MYHTSTENCAISEKKNYIDNVELDQCCCVNNIVACSLIFFVFHELDTKINLSSIIIV